MSKTNQAASRITLASGHLDGYNGPVDIIMRPHRRWWRQVLRLPAKARTERVFVDVKASNARAWRKK